MLPTILATVVTVGALLYVARPFFRGPAPAASAGAGERLELAEERDRTLAALKELEFDHRTGKVSDEDYRELIGPLRRRAVEVLRSLEPDEAALRPARSRRPKPHARVRVRS
jgi:hypothetical protein